MGTDFELIEEVKSGQTQRFGELVERYQKILLRIAFRIVRDANLAEDVVQESFMKAYTKLDSFEGRSSFKSWLIQVTLNTAKNKLRGESREITSIDQLEVVVTDTSMPTLMRKNIKEILWSEVEALPERQRLALSLRIYEDLSFKEISEIMGCPYDTAKANYRHALLKMRARLQDNAEMRSFEEFQGNDFEEAVAMEV